MKNALKIEIVNYGGLTVERCVTRINTHYPYGDVPLASQNQPKIAKTLKSAVKIEIVHYGGFYS